MITGKIRAWIEHYAKQRGLAAFIGVSGQGRDGLTRLRLIPARRATA
jgi:hypothetical protein